uniref:Putative secreted protein ovary overexpressed n=1 Tax=Rhipicephalus microplus TaxID=6941 RepID=A0A6M2DDD0_RHIMP
MLMFCEIINYLCFYLMYQTKAVKLFNRQVMFFGPNARKGEKFLMYNFKIEGVLQGASYIIYICASLL